MFGGGLLTLCLVAAVLALICLFAVLKVSGDGDRAARRTERHLIPHSEVTVTEVGAAASAARRNDNRPLIG